MRYSRLNWHFLYPFLQKSRMQLHSGFTFFSKFIRDFEEKRTVKKEEEHLLISESFGWEHQQVFLL